jgi:DNA-binding LacI/PurR family transcriptional regulator
MSEPNESVDGTRPPTMADIAAKLGVSRQLVSLVMRDAPGASDETRRRVRQAAKELGFSPHVGARSLRRARSKDLGVIFAPAHSTEPEIVERIYPAAAAHGYEVILSAQTATRSTEEAVEELLGHRCAAVIAIGATLGHAALCAVADRIPMPLVDVGYGRGNDYYDVVRSSGDKGIAMVVTYLADIGHRQIAYVDPTSMPPGRLRRRGYERTTKKFGIVADVLEMPGDYAESDYFEEVGSAAARILLQRPQLPTAVVAPNDHTAVGVLQVFLRNGVRVPQDAALGNRPDHGAAGSRAPGSCRRGGRRTPDQEPGGPARADRHRDVARDQGKHGVASSAVRSSSAGLSQDVSRSISKLYLLAA